MDQGSSLESNASYAGRTKKPFKLYFPKDCVAGKSDIHHWRINENCSAPMACTDVANVREENSAARRQHVEEDLKRNRPQFPLTSYEYGWWYEHGIQPTVSHIDFHKRTSDLVNFGIKVYEEERGAGNWKP